MEIAIDPKVLATNVKRLRESVPDLSQRRLSELAGLSSAMISKIEAGDGNPSAKTLSKIAHALHTDVKALILPEGQRLKELDPHHDFEVIQDPLVTKRELLEKISRDLAGRLKVEGREKDIESILEPSRRIIKQFEPKESNFFDLYRSPTGRVEALTSSVNSVPVYTIESLIEDKPAPIKYTNKLPWTCEGSPLSTYVFHTFNYSVINRESVSVLEPCKAREIKNGDYCIIKTDGGVFLQTASKAPLSEALTWKDENEGTEIPFNPERMQLMGKLAATFLVH